ncbi:MAG: GNAT family N-acetyltransferase [Candidatus Pacebacteria bacterium]|nr:GNAT family N-acetyltransferase [Candidatus Paceibacterota bacterium]
MSSTRETNDVIFRQSNRVTLRPVSESDCDVLTKWINDPDVQQYLEAYLPMTKNEEMTWIKTIQTRDIGSLVVMIIADGKPIGNMCISGIDHRQGTAVTGTLIGNTDYWGKGYGTEAKMLMLEYAFNVLNLRKICSDVIAFNTRSTSYSLKCGYKIEGYRKKQYFAKGKYWDQVQLAVFRKDWKPYWKAFAKEHKNNLRI